MKLGDDNPKAMLDTQVIASRSARLAEAAEKAYCELCKHKPDSLRPIYVIGSEVPMPGGSQERKQAFSQPEYLILKIP